jgi:formylglycine-generating enzyme required for sulfatase activity
MRSCAIWWVVVLAAVGTGCGKGPEQAAKQPGPAQDADVGAASEPAPKDLTVDLGGGVEMEFVLIPTGEFVMGDDRGADGEKPAHKVKITQPFYLGKYEVTQEQWEAVMGHNPSQFKGPNNPVERVSWHDCQTFLAKLNEKLGADGGEFSLPTEAQWEYACRAGTTTQYSFGDDFSGIGDYAWCGGNSEGMPHPVGQKKPNAWGLHDMHGNVLEFCADWFSDDYYRNSPAEDPAGPDSGRDRMSRGGSWSLVDPAKFRCACRGSYPPVYRSRYRGFRVARTITP